MSRAALEALIARQDRVDSLFDASQQGHKAAHDVVGLLEEQLARMGNARVSDLERRGYRPAVAELPEQELQRRRAEAQAQPRAVTQPARAKPPHRSTAKD